MLDLLKHYSQEKGTGKYLIMPLLYTLITIDNHSSGYLGLAVQLYVRAYLGPHI